MRALVTGGAGFIGSNLVDRLIADGHDVDVVDDLSSGSLDNLAAAFTVAPERVRLHRRDITDSSVVELITSCRPEVVVHLAAQIDVRTSVVDPVRDAQVNVIGSLNTLQGAVAARSRKVVFASTAATYGDVDPSQLPLGEWVSQAPASPYGVAKMAVTHYLRSFRHLRGLDYCVLTLANVYGPRQDAHGEAGVVAIFASRLLAGMDCTIYGSGDQTRDFVFVEDVADAFCRAMHQGSALSANVGTGTETSVNELYQALAGAACVDRTPCHAPARPGELQRSSLDPGTARRHLGWHARTSLTEGCARVIASTRRRLDMSGVR